MPEAANSWFDDIPVLGTLPTEDVIARLREVGEEETADALEDIEHQDNSSTVFGLRDSWFAIPPYLHTAHIFGYLAPDNSNADVLPILPVGRIRPDHTLKGTRLKITLDRLYAANYPGKGTHQILVHFFAQNQAQDSTEDLHFNATYRVHENAHAAILGYPIFVGLGIGQEGLRLKCRTINVKNDLDEGFLTLLESKVFQSGLKLATTAQPAIAPLSELAFGMARMVAERNRNVSVQDFDLGLDFSSNPVRPQLAEGAYIAVQTPDTFWDWHEWVYHIDSQQIRSLIDKKQPFPYNYIVFSISRY
jgi:hypothetical protein